MKHIAKALVVASALAAAGLAHAEKATFTLNAGPGESASAFGLTMLDLSGSGSLKFSEDLMGALDVAAIVTTGVGPSTVTNDGTSLTVSAEVASLRGTVDTADMTYAAERVKTIGGASMVAATKNFATTGGSLSVTGITVDLTQKAIYANLTGANGVGTQNNVHVWTYANIEGATVFPAVAGDVHAVNTLSGLTITEGAFNLFAQSLGLRTGGINAMRAIADYGTMTAEINVSVVPEPSTYALMGLGLVGLAFAAKRNRRA